ncbi:MAG: glycosyltransferase family 2 protein, partial [Gimesia sp.]
MLVVVGGIVLSYAILSLVHLGVQIYLAQMHHLQAAKKYKEISDTHTTISIIYPVYYETPEVLTLVMDYAKSCLHIPGLEIIFIDDGSPNRDELDPVYKKYQCEKIKVVYQENKGKRGAQHKGLEYATGEFVITVDSDTLIIPENIPKLIQPLLCDPSIGAVCGEILPKNSKTNLLTRLLDLRYWTSFNLERAAQSYLKSVLC